MECRDRQNRMLELGYGLLDAAAAGDLRAHAATCAECSAALANAESFQSLLGRAAKLNFDDVRFQSPTAEPVKPAKRIDRAFQPWVIAASLLLAIGVLGAPAMKHYFGKGNEGMAAIYTPPVPPPPKPDLRETGTREFTASSDANAKAKFSMLVIGPQYPKPGRAHDYSISASEADNKPIPVRLTVLLKDSQGKVYGKQSFETTNENTTKLYTLPQAALERLPAEGVTLHILATHPATGDRAEVAIPIR